MENGIHGLDVKFNAGYRLGKAQDWLEDGILMLDVLQLSDITLTTRLSPTEESRLLPNRLRPAKPPNATVDQ